MTLTTPMLIGLAVVLFVVAIVLAALRATRSARPPTARSGGVSHVAMEGDAERQASASSEAIEEQVNQILSKAGVTGIHVDFGTAHDGSLEIWLGDDRYLSVDSIPDERVRRAVAEAVAAYNR
jgi:hypothetical protein